MQDSGFTHPDAYDPEKFRLECLRENLIVRSRILQSIRSFFTERDFIEVETPVRLPHPALELHIDAETSGGFFLRTSPELHMKRMLAAGYERMFQLGPCFRRGERGDRHHPEYTMLEWYRAGADYIDILADTKSLITHLVQEIHDAADLMYQGRSIAFNAGWHMVSVRDAFIEFAGWDPIKDFDPVRFNEDLVDKVEPKLPKDVPTVLKDYPADLAALSRFKKDDPAVAERWELYIGGLELANAYSELTDPAEQMRRFETWSKERETEGREVYAIDPAFIGALETGLPESGGIALGIDRLVMLFTDSDSLDGVMAFRE
ncbi:MAG: EF-P lysine aminoacylase EpmA [Verrucomicrobiota bacterium]